MSARDVIAVTLNLDGWTCDAHEPNTYGQCVECRHAQQHTAARAITRLTEAGYAVVKNVRES